MTWVHTVLQSWSVFIGSRQNGVVMVCLVEGRAQVGHCGSKSTNRQGCMPDAIFPETFTSVHCMTQCTIAHTENPIHQYYSRLLHENISPGHTILHAMTFCAKKMQCPLAGPEAWSLPASALQEELAEAAGGRSLDANVKTAGTAIYLMIKSQELHSRKGYQQKSLVDCLPANTS